MANSSIPRAAGCRLAAQWGNHWRVSHGLHRRPRSVTSDRLSHSAFVNAYDIASNRSEFKLRSAPESRDQLCFMACHSSWRSAWRTNCWVDGRSLASPSLRPENPFSVTNATDFGDSAGVGSGSGHRIPSRSRGRSGRAVHRLTRIRARSDRSDHNPANASAASRPYLRAAASVAERVFTCRAA